MMKNYWRSLHGIMEAVILGIFMGIIFDPRWAPYSQDYVVLGTHIFLLIIGVLVSFRLSRIHYAGSLTVLLSRISRKGYYLASITVSTLITLFFGLCLNLELLMLVRVQPAVLFNWPMIFGSLLIIIMVVAVTHLFTIYIVKNDLTRLLAVVIVGLGAMPDWYMGLPAEGVWRFVTYLFPPMSGIINGLMQQGVGVGWWIYAGLYSLLIIGGGVYLFGRRSLTNLYY
jgi:hypothetical protein